MACVILAGCAVPGDPWSRSTSASQAHNQIMLVRKQPPSFGFQRLAVQLNAYPDLAVFVGDRGIPDFLAETANQERRYLILYYLRERQAFACRSRDARSTEVEFAGPYPVTDHEFRLLNGFRHAAADNRAARAKSRPD